MDSVTPHHAAAAVCMVYQGEPVEHLSAVQRHMTRLGYTSLCTVRPPVDHSDPIGYTLSIATSLGVAAVFVYDLAAVGYMPSRVCDMFDLETVCPPTTWTAVGTRGRGPDHSYPDHALGVAEAKRIMQQHIDCQALTCVRKACAFACLVRAGKIVPPLHTPRERAAARGLPFPCRSDMPRPEGVDFETLLGVLSALTDPRADALALAAQLVPEDSRQLGRDAAAHE